MPQLLVIVAYPLSGVKPQIRRLRVSPTTLCAGSDPCFRVVVDADVYGRRFVTIETTDSAMELWQTSPGEFPLWRALPDGSLEVVLSRWRRVEKYAVAPGQPPQLIETSPRSVRQGLADIVNHSWQRDFPSSDGWSLMPHRVTDRPPDRPTTGSQLMAMVRLAREHNSTAHTCSYVILPDGSAVLKTGSKRFHLVDRFGAATETPRKLLPPDAQVIHKWRYRNMIVIDPSD